MADVDLPAAMALWESVGGLALLKAPCGNRLVLLGDGDGQVVRWNLAQHRTVAARASTRPMEEKRDRGRHRKPATTQQESYQYESASNEGRKFEGIIVERCATLPPATGYGALKSLGTCGPGENYAVAALQQAVLHASLSRHATCTRNCRNFFVAKCHTRQCLITDCMSHTCRYHISARYMISA